MPNLLGVVPPDAGPIPSHHLAEQSGALAIAKIRPITGSPIVWKEIRTPMIANRAWRVVALIVPLALLLLVYLLLAMLDADVFRQGEVHAIFVGFMTVIGAACVCVLSATSISSEKESRSLPLLLTTTLGDWHIILGKLAGVLRRCAPAWVLPVAHVLLFTMLGMLSPLGLLGLLSLIVWVTFFLGATGLYFSARFKKTTSAVVANMGLAIGLWILIPVLMPFAHSILGALDFSWYNVGDAVMFANPVYQAGEIMALACYHDRTVYSNLMESAVALISSKLLVWGAISFVGYMLAGLFFLWRAKCRLRRNIF